MTSTIKVNNIQNQCGANIINENSNTITLGASGDTIALASGASQTGFGRSGSVNWQTNPKTATFTPVNGEGYFINSGSSLTANLPAGSAGAIVAFSDYARNFATYPFTIAANGSEKIAGQTGPASLNINGQSATFVYVDSTKGWINVQNAEDTETGSTFITATGGTITTVCTNFKVHTFTSPGTFCISAGSGPRAIVDYEVVGGGGGSAVGGGGGGGYRAAKTGCNGSYTASPLSNPTGLSVSIGAIPITVGAGGTKNPCANDIANQGSSSVFSTITSAGGGAGAAYNGIPTSSPDSVGGPGGSGGGGGAVGNPSNTEAGGTGNTPPVSPPQGTDGGDGSYDGPTHTGGGGGGGATAAGADAPGDGGPSTSSGGGVGGAGATNNITGSPVARAGGGGGGVNTTGNTGPFAGGTGGGGAGVSPGSSPSTGGNGTVNTGGGGGGGVPGGSKGASGGSGIVIIRYKFQ